MKKTNHEIKRAPAASVDVETTKEGFIRGYGSVFGVKDQGGDIVVEGAFAKSIESNLRSGERPLMLWQHDPDRPIGRWTAMREDSKGLYLEGKLNLSTFAGNEAFEHIRAGDLNGLSIGYITKREKKVRGGRELTELDLREISLVSFPMNRSARIEGVKGFGTKADTIETLRGCGLSKREAQRFAGGGWKALGNDTYDETKINELAWKLDRVIEQVRN